MWISVGVVFVIFALVFMASAVNAKDGFAGLLSFVVAMLALFLTYIGSKDGIPLNIQNSSRNLLVAGQTYKVVGVIPQTDIVAIQDITKGTITMYSVGEWHIPPCFVETSASDETQFQKIECPK